MKFLLDTNIISETIRPQPSINVQNWLQVVPADSLFISVLTFGEIRKRIEKLADSKRKNTLVLWLERDLPKWFGENVLPIDQEIAERWGYLMATMNNRLMAIDSLLAATALTHNLKMVTRNVKIFHLPGLEVINPFE